MLPNPLSLAQWIVADCANRMIQPVAKLRLAELDENMDDLLTGLEHHAGELKYYADAVFTLVDRLSGPLAAEVREPPDAAADGCRHARQGIAPSLRAGGA
jgi:hypothetical protein